MSLDSASAHRHFREKECLPFDLLVDRDGAICRLYDVPVTNLLVVRLADRMTYVIGKDGRIRQAWSGVKPQGHAAEVLASLS